VYHINWARKVDAPVQQPPPSDNNPDAGSLDDDDDKLPF